MRWIDPPGRPRVRPAIKTPRGKGKHKAVGRSSASSSPAGMKSSPRAAAPPSSFMHSSQVGGSAGKKRAVLADDSTSEEGSSDDDVELPVRGVRRGGKRQLSLSESSGRASADGEGNQEVEKGDESDEDDEDDEDDKPLVTPTARRKRRVVVDESDEDDQPLISSPIKRRRLVRRNEPSSPAEEDEDEEEEKEEGEEEGEKPAPSSVRPKRTGRKPLTRKEKAREQRRRKRAGEAINEEEESSSSGEEPAKAMYDTDSDNLALNDFEDDEEGVIHSTTDPGTKESGKQNKRREVDNGDEDSESLDDFVVDDGDEPLGIPEEVYQDMPLEYTAHSHKPLKEHFRDAIEWLVQFKINPGFADKEHPLYRMAWKKLDDETRALATSKFASSAWKK